MQPMKHLIYVHRRTGLSSQNISRRHREVKFPWWFRVKYSHDVIRLLFVYFLGKICRAHKKHDSSVSYAGIDRKRTHTHTHTHTLAGSMPLLRSAAVPSFPLARLNGWSGVKVIEWLPLGTLLVQRFSEDLPSALLSCRTGQHWDGQSTSSVACPAPRHGRRRWPRDQTPAQGTGEILAFTGGPGWHCQLQLQLERTGSVREDRGWTVTYTFGSFFLFPPRAKAQQDIERLVHFQQQRHNK